MDVYTTWCGPCKMMMKNTFTNPNVIDYINANYYAIKFDAESGKEITFKGNVYSIPDLIRMLEEETANTNLRMHYQ